MNMFWICCATTSFETSIGMRSFRNVFRRNHQTMESWYSVALKKPNRLDYYFWDSYNPTFNFQTNSDINEWIHNCFTKTKQKWNGGQILYNDQLPTGYKECEFLNGINNSGHCKGIVAWNNNKIGWLIHSIPKYPSHSMTEDGVLPHISLDDAKFGQSMIYCEFPISYKNEILQQICMMDAQLYHYTNNIFNDEIKSTTNNEDIILLYFKNCSKENTLNVVSLPKTKHLIKSNINIRHYAKNRFYEKDIYEHIFSMRNYTALKCQPNTNYMPILCETWIRGQELHSTQWVKNIQKLKEWNEQNDHSKWAISMPYEKKILGFTYKKNWYRVCISDLNRMKSQLGRGGGGIVIDGNKSLWTCFNNLIVSYKDEHNNIIVH